ncbi:hypothetical protein VCRA2121O337_170026 [Vibrio crassostreae]|nr:hypothetical protein VCRA2127O345_160026 [Vibrio crassostreae]CAK3264446.1 hypothetical protein VCRA2120E330_170110 [Vibrio crassostreae]CAK3345184.1 hypothetical protein VCRA2122O340_160112 [Vibrio crassostreae]CAK3734778.1 hypothetical protein VCRA2121O337_170026 [Vibrio crassostreae]CAK3776761.1 hypothetical protein VCRA2128O346_160112 [Vibrio crassostreae]
MVRKYKNLRVWLTPLSDKLRKQNEKECHCATRFSGYFRRLFEQGKLR